MLNYNVQKHWESNLFILHEDVKKKIEIPVFILFSVSIKHRIPLFLPLIPVYIHENCTIDNKLQFTENTAES